MMKLKGLKKAVGDFNHWQGCAVIMADIAYGEVWCDIFSSGNEWKQYHRDTIHKVISKATSQMWERDNTTTMKEVEELIREEWQI